MSKPDRVFMTKENRIRFLLVGACAVASVAILYGGINFGQDLGGSVNLVVTTDKDGRGQAFGVIRKRVGGLGLVEPAVSRHGSDQVLIRLSRCNGSMIPVVKRLCRETGLLSLHLVRSDNAARVKELWDSKSAPEGYGIETVSGGKHAGRNYYVRTNDSMASAHAATLSSFHAPSQSKSLFALVPAFESGKRVFTPCFVDQQPELANAAVERAWTIQGIGGEWSVGIQLGQEGKLAYREITSKHRPHGSQNNDSDTGRELAVLMDSRCLAVFEIPGAVFDGRVFIDRIVTLEEAKHMRSICESGSLQGVTRIEEGTAAPDLGSGVVRGIFLAVLIGGLVVLFLMAAGWPGYGLIMGACVAMVVVLLPFGMVVAAGLLELIGGASGARSVFALPVLTLWGLAGMGLSLAAWLGLHAAIMQRTAEGVRAGSALEIAAANGYGKAQGSIIDAGAVGMIAGLLLFLTGTDQLRGFSVGLCAGTISNLLVILVAARALFSAAIPGRLRDAFGKVTAAPSGAGFEFVQKRVYAIALSIGAILVTWGILVFNSIHGRQLVLVPDPWKTAWAAVAGTTGVGIFVMLRFGPRYAAGLIAAVVNALVLTAGFFCLSGRPIGPAVSAALAIVAGCSVFVVLGVFAWTGELGQEMEYRRKAPAEFFNLAIGRAVRHMLLTCGSVIIGAVALLLVCRGPVVDFGLALCIGAFCSAFSSLFIAVPVVLAFNRAAPEGARKRP